MINKIDKKGFTLIELLVVISIIAVIVTLSTVYFNTARMTSRDSRRLLDIKQIQLALKMFYADTGIYPTAITAGSAIANGGNNYLLRVPYNPSPRNDGSCPDQEYYYQQLESGQRYSLTFCLGDQTDDLNSGSHTATANGILNCPTNYVAVPGSAIFNTNDFCVMKYEAKCAEVSAPTVGLTSPATANSTYDNSNGACLTDNGNGLMPVSVSSGLPIGNISEAEAITYCQSIGEHLITNNEWMTIARNLEKVNANWSNNLVGDAYLNIGNYNGSQAMDGTNPSPGGEDFSYRRTSYLSTGDSVWDFTGNVNEWVDASCSQTNYYDSNGNQTQWTDSNLDDYERGAAGPADANYSKPQNTGNYIGCANEGNIFLRGGSADETIASGIYSLDLRNNNETIPNALTGFRCVK